ncbi:MAG: MBL fold metallo-hydrolase, partial [Phycisphaeraceae bacterium]
RALAGGTPDAGLKTQDAGPRTPLSASVLGSGSGGNSTVIRAGDAAFLIDAGFGPRTTNDRLKQLGLSVADIRAVCLTHLDQDHFRPAWVRTLVAHGIRLFLHRWHRKHLDRVEGSEALHHADLVHFFETDAFTPVQVPGLAITTVRLPHDDKGTSAFHIQTPASRLGYATDLGHVPDAMIAAFAGVDVLMLESNYDPQMQITSARPLFLKKRIMGGHGHLSNEQALDACRRIADRSARGNPQRIVLLHRSAQCNTAELVRRTFEQDARFADRIVITQQRRKTPWISVEPLEATKREQIGMFT